MTAPATADATARISVERRWRAMGTEAQLIVVGATDTGPHSTVAERLKDLADRAVGRVADLEGRWSRFLPASEIGALNRVGWATASPETFALIDRAVLAWRRTNGRFDPTLLDALEQLGYDRSFDELGPIDRPAHDLIRRTRPVWPSRAVDAGEPIDFLPTGCAGIVLDPFTRAVILPATVDPQGDPGTDNRKVGFDPGGIGKGFAADLVVEELLTAGAAGALVNLGGDLRVEGTPPSGHGWVLEVGEAAWTPEPLAVLELERGAVATSTPLRRRWTVVPCTGKRPPSATAHHLLDPGTGRSTGNGPFVVTAIAGESWWAEAVATAVAATPVTEWSALFGRLDGATVAAGQAAVAAVGTDGGLRLWGGFEHFMRTTPSRPEPVPGLDEEHERWCR